MKRVTFKTELKNLDEALTKIPQVLKEDQKVFELTDGNKTYKIRWEGSLTEGEAIPLSATDNNLINEDMKRMKELYGYTSEPTLGALKGQERLNENSKFTELLSIKKKK